MAEMEVTESEGDRRKCILYHVQLYHSEMFGRPRTVLSFVRAVVRAQMRGSIGAVRELANPYFPVSCMFAVSEAVSSYLLDASVTPTETYRIQSNLQRHNSMNTANNKNTRVPHAKGPSRPPGPARPWARRSRSVCHCRRGGDTQASTTK